MKQLYVTEPDGYGLCFQWPATKSTCDQWQTWYGLDFSNDGETVSGTSKAPTHK